MDPFRHINFILKTQRTHGEHLEVQCSLVYFAAEPRRCLPASDKSVQSHFITGCTLQEAVLQCAVLHCIAVCSASLYYSVGASLYCSVQASLYCSVQAPLYCSVLASLYCSVQCFTVLQCAVLHCTALCSTSLNSTTAITLHCN